MAKTAAKKLDELIAAELNLRLSDHTAMIHHVVRLVGNMQGFIFVFTQGDQVFYDTVDTWNEVNGMRLRIARFRSHPVVEERLVKRTYKRWYVWGNGLLVPMNMTKVEDLKDKFNFKVDDCPGYRTSIVAPQEVPCIRSKPLLAHRKSRPEWGVQINTTQKLERAV